MCTVTYMPTGEDQFILTSNRDEAPSRSPKSITREIWEQQQMLFPKDTKAGGTWIAVSSQNQVACLLNGAFEKHKHQPPYKMSRGKMVLEIFKASSPITYFDQFDLDGIEPFTLIFFHQEELWEFRWDEKILHQTPLPVDSPRIWSSSTLYPQEIKAKREAYFEDWLRENHQYNQEKILHLHRTGSIGDPWYDFIMNRNNVVRTVSITSIHKAPEKISMQYHDILHPSESPAFDSLEL